MTHGSKVRLMTFEGLSTPPCGCVPAEDYWKLIGKEGWIALDPFKCCKDDRYSDERKLLVVFDLSFETLGLCSHQKDENSLWVSVTDLSEVT